MPNPTSLASLYERLAHRQGVIRELIMRRQDFDSLRQHERAVINNLLANIRHEVNPDYRRELEAELNRYERTRINFPAYYTPHDFYNDWDEIDYETDPTRLRKFRNLIMYFYPNRSQIFTSLVSMGDDKEFIIACRNRLRQILIEQLRRYDIIPVGQIFDTRPPLQQYMNSPSRYRDPNIQRRYSDV